MAAERADHSKGNEGDKSAGAAAPAAAPTTAPSGFKAWLPLVLNVALMPVLAFFTTTYFLAPKAKVEHASAAGAEGGHTAKSEEKSERGAAPTMTGRNKFGVPLSGKVLVNIAGTMGTRYLLANLTLVSSQATLRDAVERNDAELRDVAAGILATKTIADLEKPGARNLIRTELISAFNGVLGEGTVSELYLTEFAIQ